MRQPHLDDIFLVNSSASTTGMSLGKKLTLCLVAVAGLGMACSYSSLQAIHKLGAMLDAATNVAARRMDLVSDIRAGFQGMEDHA